MEGGPGSRQLEPVRETPPQDRSSRPHHVPRTLPIVAFAAAWIASPPLLQAQTGSVAGTVQLAGEASPGETVEVTSDRGYCGRSIEPRDVATENGRVQNAVVWIEGAEGEPEPRRRKLLNDGCRFDPGHLAAAVGDTLVVENRDSLLHNMNMKQTYSRGEMAGETRPLGNFSLPLAGMSVERPDLIEAPGVIEVTCDAHGWMEARVRVFDHPYFAVSGPEGKMAIDDVPPGTYRLHVRHPAVGSIERRVTVGAGERTRVDLTLEP